MSSTYLGLFFHVVFSTREREPAIRPDWMPRLHEYLGGTVKQLHGVTHGVGGVADHVHLLVELQATHCLADFMRELKKSSSSWIRDEMRCPTFAWQEGYAALTVSPSAVNDVREYIHGQAEHHRHRDYREEVLAMLRKAGVAVDERYFD